MLRKNLVFLFNFSSSDFAVIVKIIIQDIKKFGRK